MIVKLCVRYECAAGFSEQESERIVDEIRHELHEWNCDCGPIPELADDGWVFELDCGSSTTASDIVTWVRNVISVIESKLRRLADDEWIVLIDRKSIWAMEGDPCGPST